MSRLLISLMRLRALFVFVALLILAALSAPAQAAQVSMCAPDVAGGLQGPRTVGGTNSQVPSQTLYSLNSVGCALIQQADIGWFQAQGYTQSSSQQSLIYTTGVLTGTTDVVIGNLPAGAYIQAITVTNATANAVTGGISFGTTANGTQFLATLACAANCASGVSSITSAAYSTTSAQAIHAAAVTAWASANVTITVTYAYF